MNGRLEDTNTINTYIEKKLEKLPYYVRDWHETMFTNGTMPTTRKIYINRIASFINDMEIKDLSDINRANVTRWLNSNSHKKNDPTKETSGSHRQAVWMALKNFLIYLQDEGLIKNVVTYSGSKIKLGAIGCPKGDKDDAIKNRRIILTEKELNGILDAVENVENDILRTRDKAIISLFITTGMRETALMEINLEDVDFDNNTIKYIDKREKYFVKEMNDMVRDNIKEWLIYRPEYAERSSDPSDALFISNRGQRLSPTALMSAVKKYSKLGCGIEVSPHKLRSGFITVMYNHTGDIEFVRRVIGHTNTSTTQKYIRVSDEELNNKAKDILAKAFGT